MKMKTFSRPLPLIAMVLSITACAGNDFESGVLVETEPCANNTGPWNGLNEHKVQNDDGSLTVYRCHFKLAVADDAPCPGIGDPLCESNWRAITIGSSSGEVRQQLGAPLDISGIRWQYPNNNSISVDNGVVTNIFQRSASLYK